MWRVTVGCQPITTDHLQLLTPIHKVCWMTQLDQAIWFMYFWRIDVYGQNNAVIVNTLETIKTRDKKKTISMAHVLYDSWFYVCVLV